MIDLTKPLQTRDGRKVRIYATDGGMSGVAEPIHGAFHSMDGWFVTSWRLDGMQGGGMAQGGIDLVNVPAPIDRRLWMNFTPNDPDGVIGMVFTTKQLADQFATATRIACIQIQIKGNEGDGL